MSRVFIPVGPLKQNKVRLDIHELFLSGDAKSGNENEIRLIWTSKGKQVRKNIGTKRHKHTTHKYERGR